MNKWLQNIVDTKSIQSVINISKKIVVPGFEGHSLFYVTRFFFKGLKEGAIGTRAASVSFRIIMAILPFFILLLSFLPKIDGFQKNLFEGVSAILPGESFQLIESTVKEMISGQSTALLSIGFILTIYYASNSISAILFAFNSSVNLTERRSFLSQKLVGVLLIMVFALIIFVAVGLITLSKFLVIYLVSKGIMADGFQVYIFYFLNYLLLLLLFMVAISILYHIGNRDAKKWKLITPGSLFASFLMILVSAAFAYYVNNFNSYNKFYGSLGAIIAFFIWINFNSTILIMGFELNTSISRASIQRSRNNEK